MSIHGRSARSQAVACFRVLPGVRPRRHSVTAKQYCPSSSAVARHSTPEHAMGRPQVQVSTLLFEIRVGCLWYNQSCSAGALMSAAQPGRDDAPSDVAAPGVLAKRCVGLMLPSQFNHQTERVFHRLLLACMSGSLLGFCHQRVVDLDIGAHRRSIFMCIIALYNTHRASAIADAGVSGDRFASSRIGAVQRATASHKRSPNRIFSDIVIVPRRSNIAHLRRPWRAKFLSHSSIIANRPRLPLGARCKRQST
jgi:hypothetical protein